MDAVTIIKEHPLSIVAAAVVVLVIIASSKGSSGSSSSAALSATLQSQSIASQANTEIAKINANADVARGAQNVDLAKTQISAAAQSALARTSLISSMFDTSTKAQATLAGLDTQAHLQQTLAMYQHKDNQTTLANQLQLGEKAIAASTAQNAQKMQTAITMQQNDNNAKLNALGKTLDSNYSSLLAKIGLDKYKTDVTAANLPALLQSQQTMAQISAANAQALLSISTQAQRTAATVNAVDSGVGILQSLFGTLPANAAGGGGGGGGGGDFMGDILSAGAEIFGFL